MEFYSDALPIRQSKDGINYRRARRFHYSPLWPLVCRTTRVKMKKKGTGDVLLYWIVTEPPWERQKERNAQRAKHKYEAWKRHLNLLVSQCFIPRYHEQHIETILQILRHEREKFRWKLYRICFFFLGFAR